MPRYHFNVYDGVSTPDEEGTELPDWPTARIAAIRLTGEILKDEADRIDTAEQWRIEVTDHTGLVLFQMAFHVVEATALDRDSRHEAKDLYDEQSGQSRPRWPRSADTW